MENKSNGHNSNDSLMTTVSRTVSDIWNTVQSRVYIPPLKSNRPVPSLYIRCGQSHYCYPLLGDRYVIGRSSKNCDIVIRSPIVSQIHCVVERDEKNPRQFVIRDLNSTNGVYYGGKRCDCISLYHNDVVTLGPPELAEGIEIRFDKGLSWWVYLLRYGVFTTGFGLLLGLGFISWEWSKYQVYPIPDHVGGQTVVYANDGKTLLVPRIDSPIGNWKAFRSLAGYQKPLSPRKTAVFIGILGLILLA